MSEGRIEREVQEGKQNHVHDTIPDDGKPHVRLVCVHSAAFQHVFTTRVAVNHKVVRIGHRRPNTFVGTAGGFEPMVTVR